MSSSRGLLYKDMSVVVATSDHSFGHRIFDRICTETGEFDFVLYDSISLFLSLHSVLAHVYNPLTAGGGSYINAAAVASVLGMTSWVWNGVQMG